MSYHRWHSQCPYCGFDHLIVESDGGLNFALACPLCGFESSTLQREPTTKDVALAVHILTQFDERQRRDLAESWWDDKTPFVQKIRLK